VAHQHYKGTGQMHSFRGLLADGKQDKIRIEGATGEIAWRITKFEIFPAQPGEATYESTVQIWRDEQATPSTSTLIVSFDNDELLAAAYYGQYSTISSASQAIITTFDNQLFVRNLFVTHTNVEGSGVGSSINYYIELEEVKVGAAGMAQLAVAAARRNRFTSD